MGLQHIRNTLRPVTRTADVLNCNNQLVSAQTIRNQPREDNYHLGGTYEKGCKHKVHHYICSC